MRPAKPANQNAFSRDSKNGCFHVDLVLPDCTWGVYGTFTGHCYATYTERDNADAHALRLVTQAMALHLRIAG